MKNLLIWSLDAVSELYSYATLPFYYAANLALPACSTRCTDSSNTGSDWMPKAVKIDYPGSDEDGSYPAVWASSNVVDAAKKAGDKSVADCLATRQYPGVDNLSDLLQLAARRFPDRPCLGTRQLLAEEEHAQQNGRIFKKQSLGPYSWLTYSDVARLVSRVSRGLRSLGLRAGDRVALYAETRADWQICAQACFRCGLPAVTLYASLGEDALAFGVDQSEASVLVTSLALLDRVRPLLARMPRIRYIVYMDSGVGDDTFPRPSESQLSPEGAPVDRPPVRLFALSQLGAGESDSDEADAAAAIVNSDSLAVMMYTSGSTGQPKGVMISHANLLSMAAGVALRIPELGRQPDDSYLAYLPLAHVLELAAELACLANGVAIGYGSPLTLTDASNKVKPGTPGDASALRPSLLAAVPAVLDRASRAVRDRAESRGALAKALLIWAMAYKMRWGLRGWSTPLLDYLVFSKISAILGGRLRLLLSGGAPLSTDTHSFAMAAFGASVVQGFGLTETSGAGSIQCSSPASSSSAAMATVPLSSAGPPLDCCLLRLRDWPEGGYLKSDKPWPRGELLIGGPCVTAGYFRMPELTRQDYWTDDSGMRWFCTGDIGQMDGDKGLQIVDRKKDLVKLQGGEYISLGKVELAMSSSPLVEQLCAFADSHRDFVVLLVVPKQSKLYELAVSLGLIANEANGDCLHAVNDSLLNDKRLKAAVLKELTATARGRLERFELPDRLHLCSETAWLPESGLVTDSFKLRRRQLLDYYRKEIDAMYQEN